MLLKFPIAVTLAKLPLLVVVIWPVPLYPPEPPICPAEFKLKRLAPPLARMSM